MDQRVDVGHSNQTKADSLSGDGPCGRYRMMLRMQLLQLFQQHRCQFGAHNVALGLRDRNGLDTSLAPVLRAGKFQQAPADKSVMRMQVGVAISILSGDGFEFIEPGTNYSG